MVAATGSWRCLVTGAKLQPCRILAERGARPPRTHPWDCWEAPAAESGHWHPLLLASDAWHPLLLLASGGFGRRRPPAAANRTILEGSGARGPAQANLSTSDELMLPLGVERHSLI